MDDGLAARLGSARLREISQTLKREMHRFAERSGGPLASAAMAAGDAFQGGNFAQSVRAVIGGFDQALLELAEDLAPLCSRLEMAADEDEAIRKMVADGFPPPSRQVDLEATVATFAKRTPARRLPLGHGSAQTSGGSLRFSPERARNLEHHLRAVAGEVEANRRRLADPLSWLTLDTPPELTWIPQDAETLASEVRSRTEAFLAAEAQATQAAASSLVAAFAGLFSARPRTAGAAPAPAVTHPPAPAPTSTAIRPPASAPAGPVIRPPATPPAGVPPRRRGAGAGRRDGKRLGAAARSRHWDEAGRVLAEAKRRSEKDPAYAKAFLEGLGPMGLRELLVDDRRWGDMAVCDLVTVVARGSRAGASHDILAQALGRHREPNVVADRAAVLAACDQPEATFDPRWVDTLALKLARGRDPWGFDIHDPRLSYRRHAANLLVTNPEGAIRFTNRHPVLFGERFLNHSDDGGLHLQANLHHILGSADPGLAKESEDALERVLRFVAEPGHELDPAGKQALAASSPAPRRSKIWRSS